MSQVCPITSQLPISQHSDSFVLPFSCPIALPPCTIVSLQCSIVSLQCPIMSSQCHMVSYYAILCYQMSHIMVWLYSIDLSQWPLMLSHCPHLSSYLHDALYSNHCDLCYKIFICFILVTYFDFSVYYFVTVTMYYCVLVTYHYSLFCKLALRPGILTLYPIMLLFCLIVLFLGLERLSQSSVMQ